MHDSLPPSLTHTRPLQLLTVHCTRNRIKRHRPPPIGISFNLSLIRTTATVPPPPLTWTISFGQSLGHWVLIRVLGRRQVISNSSPKVIFQSVFLTFLFTNHRPPLHPPPPPHYPYSGRLSVWSLDSGVPALTLCGTPLVTRPNTRVLNVDTIASSNHSHLSLVISHPPVDCAKGTTSVMWCSHITVVVL